MVPFRDSKLSRFASSVITKCDAMLCIDAHDSKGVGAICLVCRSGGTGRRTGLKILRDLYSRTGSIPVFGTIFNIAEWSSWQLVGLITRRSQVRVLPPQPNKYGPLVKRSRHRPFTAVTGVRFPYGSPIPGTIAQLGEHLPYKQGVTGSSPVSPTNYINAAW